MGCVEFQVAKLMGSPNNLLILDLNLGERKMGKVVVRSEQVDIEDYELAF